MRDKDIEARLRVVKEVLKIGNESSLSPPGSQPSHKFQLPLNISISIFQTIVNMITNEKITPPSKDFLIQDFVEVLQQLLCMNEQLANDANAEYHTLHLIKWILHLIKDRVALSPSLFSTLFTLLSKITQNMRPTLAPQMLPQISSVVTKMLTDDLGRQGGRNCKG